MKYDREFLRHLVEYTIFADAAGFEAAATLPEDEYYAARNFSFGSIHNLLVHQMVAQKTWLRRWMGEVFVGRLENHTEHPTRPLLQERWAKVHADLLDFVSSQTSESLNKVMTVRRGDGELITAPLGAMVMHVADHGSYHRGQLASMLKQAGVAKPPYTPYFRFAIQHAAEGKTT